MQYFYPGFASTSVASWAWVRATRLTFPCSLLSGCRVAQCAIHLAVLIKFHNSLKKMLFSSILQLLFIRTLRVRMCSVMRHTVFIYSRERNLDSVSHLAS